jgi:hypothetical protein
MGLICNSLAGKIHRSKRLEAADGGCVNKPAEYRREFEHFIQDSKFYKIRALAISKNFTISRAIPTP